MKVVLSLFHGDVLKLYNWRNGYYATKDSVSWQNTEQEKKKNLKLKG